jgi:hydrogenase maturation protease
VTSQQHLLVIGYGNTLRADDGLGRCIADQLAQTLDQEQVEIISCHQLTLDLADPISRASHVILIDAASGNTPGTIACETVVPDTDHLMSMLHYMDPGTLLASTEAMYGRVPPTTLWTVTAESFDYRESLSPCVQQAVPDLLQRLQAFILPLLADGVSIEIQ